MLMYDCDGLGFCNNEATFGYDCYVLNEFCEDFNGDGIVDSWVGDGWCDDGEWGYDFQCEEYSFDCGDCGDEYADNDGYCSHIVEMFEFEHNGVNRDYYFYRPESLEPNSPLVFVLHGYSGNANSIMSYSKMNSIADENGFEVSTSDLGIVIGFSLTGSTIPSLLRTSSAAFLMILALGSKFLYTL